MKKRYLCYLPRK